MSLPTQTITKLLRQSFTGKQPIKIRPAERPAFIAALKERLAELNHVKAETSQWYSSEQEKARRIYAFSIEDPHDQRSYRNTFQLSTNERDELVIDRYREKMPISSLDELVNFITAYREGLARKQAQKLRQQKVRDLKAQAIVAQVKKLAKEDKFDFMTDADTVKLLLFVKLSAEDCIQLQVPFSKFEEMLPKLRTSIQALRDLHENGIKFKLCDMDSVGWRDRWIKHESL